MSDSTDERNTIAASYQNGVLRIVLKRAPLNVLNIAMMRELKEVLESNATANEARVLALQGEGKAFCAGVDVAEHTPDRVSEMLEAFHSLIRLVRSYPIPTVALVHGAALGGGAELACACDLVLAGEAARFGQPEILLGVFPPVAMVDLPRSIGMRKAAELIFCGETISAREALAMGLVNRVFPAESFLEHAGEYLRKFTRLSRSSLAQTKKAFQKVTAEIDYEKALQLAESHYLQDLMVTEDAREGIASFMEKREAVWRHR
ncbi:MAG: enoyl-CoA hydratase/isomerase family protein [Acidobacteriota bacterium]